MICLSKYLARRILSNSPRPIPTKFPSAFSFPSLHFLPFPLSFHSHPFLFLLLHYQFFFLSISLFPSFPRHLSFPLSFHSPLLLISFPLPPPSPPTFLPSHNKKAATHLSNGFLQNLAMKKITSIQP